MSRLQAVRERQSPPLTVLPERIDGEGIVLRRWLETDADAIAQAVTESLEHLRPWMAWASEEPQTIEQRRALIARWEREWAEGGDAVYGIFVEGAVAGGCGLHRRRGPRTLEIGYWIHRDFTRRGIATAVSRMLTAAAFAVPEIEHVEIHHDKANVASAGVPRRLGFTLVEEQPDERVAPAEIGVDCTWRIHREQWEDVAGFACTGPDT